MQARCVWRGGKGERGGKRERMKGKGRREMEVKEEEERNINKVSEENGVERVIESKAEVWREKGRITEASNIKKSSQI